MTVPSDPREAFHSTLDKQTPLLGGILSFFSVQPIVELASMITIHLLGFCPTCTARSHKIARSRQSQKHLF